MTRPHDDYVDASYAHIAEVGGLPPVAAGYWSVRDVVVYLGKSHKRKPEEMIYRYVAQGRLKTAGRIGRQMLFTKALVDAFVRGEKTRQA